MRQEKVKPQPCMFHRDREGTSQVTYGPLAVCVCEQCYKMVIAGLHVSRLIGEDKNGNTNDASSSE